MDKAFRGGKFTDYRYQNLKCENHLSAFLLQGINLTSLQIYSAE